MTTLCICGNDEWRMEYEAVPYGATVAWMESREVCTECGREYDEFNTVTICDRCESPIEECECDER